MFFWLGRQSRFFSIKLIFIYSYTYMFCFVDIGINMLKFSYFTPKIFSFKNNKKKKMTNFDFLNIQCGILSTA